MTSLLSLQIYSAHLIQPNMDDPPLASLSLTHVHYNSSDPLSHISAYLALVPQALMITYVALIWSTREIEILLMFAGQMRSSELVAQEVDQRRKTDAYVT